jgi:hypothetical protein
MDNVLALGLALAFVFFVLKFNKRHRKKSLSQLSYSQSSIHNIIKDFIPKRLFERPEVVSQSRKHTEKHMVKIIVLDNNAYWVKDNIFYTAKTKNGNIIDETVKPVDIDNMPKKELDKMLFILDNLGRGKNDDSSSSGNE